ncbi:MAG TPA: zf-HC2 domain-containing protein [Bacillota bacterium]|nr:zf-HC2 domain-containing protein [Bacillota bacterium]
MNCNSVQNLISAYIDCELDAREKREFRLHLCTCSECTNEYQEILALKDFLQNIAAEPVSFDPLSRLKGRLENEDRSLIRQVGKVFWFGRVGVVTACLGVFFAITWIFYPVDEGANRNMADNHIKNLSISPVSFDQNLTVDQSISVYQASYVVP